MPQTEAAPWWADVEHLRERIESRRAHEAPPAQTRERGARRNERAPAAGPRERRTVRISGRGAHAPAPRRLVASERRGATPRAMHGAVGRPDRIALWAVLLGFVLVLVATTSAHAATSLGDRALRVPMEGRDVRHLQLRLKRLGLLRAPATAHYGRLTRGAVKRFQRTRCLDVDGIAGPATIDAIHRRAAPCRAGGRRGTSRAGGTSLRRRVVTWYGPGMYGRRTACGQELTRRLIGVAHRTLPCGTPVRLVHGASAVTARVVDRGPYASGVHYDLTWAAARKLGVLAAGRATVRASR